MQIIQVIQVILVCDLSDFDIFFLEIPEIDFDYKIPRGPDDFC